MICITHQVLFVGSNEKTGIGMACSNYRGKEWCYRNLVEKPEL